MLIMPISNMFFAIQNLKGIEDCNSCLIILIVGLILCIILLSYLVYNIIMDFWLERKPYFPVRKEKWWRRALDWIGNKYANIWRKTK